MNRWNIPDWLEQEVIARDRECVYCRVSFDAESPERRQRPSWEHIINDATIINRENIARCCMGCNASKGNKKLDAWLQTGYCRSRGITIESVSEVVKAVLSSDSQANQDLL